MNIDWPPGARLATVAMMSATTIAVLIPRLVSSISGYKSGNVRVVDRTAENNAAYNGLLANLSTALILLVATLLIAKLILNRTRIPAPGLIVLLALPSLIYSIQSVAIYRTIPYSVLIPGAFVFLFVSYRVPVRGVGVAASVASQCIILVSLALGIFLPESALFRSSAGENITLDKAIIGNSLLNGIFGHPNSMALFAAFGAVLAFSIRSRFWRMLSLCTSCWALLWAASRTALFGVVLALFVLIVLATMRSRSLRAAWYWLVAVSLVIVGSVLPFVTNDPFAFSGRGQIWIGSLAAVQDHLFFGMGPNWYAYIANFSNSLVSVAVHGHNMFLHVLVTGGLVMFAAVIILFCVVLRGGALAVVSGDGWVLAFLTVLLVSLMQEVPLGMAGVGDQLIATWPVCAALGAACLATPKLQADSAVLSPEVRQSPHKDPGFANGRMLGS